MTVGPQHEEGFTPGSLYGQTGVQGADGSIPNMYNLDQPAAEAMMKSTYVEGNPKINDPLNDSYAGLRPGIPMALSIIESITQTITGIISLPFLIIDQALQTLAAFFGGLMGQVSNAGQAAETAVALFNFGAAQSIWGAANPTFETSIPLGDLRKPSVTAGVVGTDNDPWSTTVVQASSGGAFVRCALSQNKTVAQWLGKGNVNITSCKFHVWRLNTVTGDLTFVQTETVVPASLPNAAFDFVNVPLTPPVHVEPGDQLLGEVCVTGTGTHIMAGLDMPWLPDDDTARPKRKGITRNSGTESSPPATILDPSVPYSGETPYIGFGMLLSDLPTPKYTYTDTFDGGTMNWTALAGSLDFSDGVFKTGTALAPNFALFTPAPNGDEARIEFSFRADFATFFPPPGRGNFVDGDIIRLMMHCSPDVSQFVGIEIVGTGSIFNLGAGQLVRIVTGTSPTGPTIVRTTPNLFTPNLYTARMGLEYDPPTNTYGLFLDTAASTTPDVTWVDTGNVIRHGPGFRQGAIYVNFAVASTPGQLVCDDFSYRDL